MSDQKNLNCLWTRHNNRVYDIDGVQVLRVSDFNTVVSERVVAEHNALLGIDDIEGFMATVKSMLQWSLELEQDAVDEDDNNYLTGIKKALALFPKDQS